MFIKFLKKGIWENFIVNTFFVLPVCIFVVFQLTVEQKIREISYEIEKIRSKENIERIKDKLRDELRNAINKENYCLKKMLN